MVLRRSLLLLIALLLPTIAFATTTYVVKKGDNLYDLSRKFGVSVEDITELNKLKNNNLGIGYELLIPGNDSQSNNNYSNNNYIVKSGDTISQIADKLGVKSKDLKSANNLKNDRLQIGQELYIPLKSKTNISKTSSVADTKLESIQNETPVRAEIPQEEISNAYVVKKGDTLGHIAEKHAVKTNDLKKANNLKNNNLQIGQKLVIPNLAVVKETSETKEVVTSSKTELLKTTENDSIINLTVSNVYTVQKGDTIYDLSNKFKISKDNLTKWNNLDKSNLSIGQKLYLTPNKEIRTASNKSDNKVSKPQYSGDYKVKKGDTLGHIASNHGISVKDLKNANNLTTNNLKIGKVLKVPALTKQNKTVAKSAKTVNRTSATKYTVKKGDTLGGISNSYGVSVAKIKEASSLKSNNIKVGDVLLIPGTQKTPSSSTYTVVSGDTLGGIGNKFGVSVKELRTLNNLKSSYLQVGMKLTVSGNSKAAQPSVQTAKKAAQKPSARYIVKSGESLGIIAQRYGVSVTSIVNANNLKGQTIRAGQTINIPSAENYRDYAGNTEYSSNNESTSYKKTKENIITVAKQYLGAPYKFGGSSFKTGIDCSGYVKKIFSKFNVELPRTARDIYYNTGTRVAKNQLQTGDLVFFRTYASYPSHVGIYMGNGQFIHASSGARKVSITSLNKKYYTKRYIGAKRIQLSAVFEKEYSQR
ncbi:MAG: LysM peptidoglycan-binding domain-containing protein [Thermodesulfobacteriales bacterium]|nr:MAG: LysM peptidoglycan-binding domain-containing protein [Thermodesulfobacteriales bacterium]